MTAAEALALATECSKAEATKRIQRLQQYGWIMMPAHIEPTTDTGDAAEHQRRFDEMMAEAKR